MEKIKLIENQQADKDSVKLGRGILLTKQKALASSNDKHQSPKHMQKSGTFVSNLLLLRKPSKTSENLKSL